MPINALHESLSELVVDATRAQPFEARTPVGFDEPTAYIAKPAARSIFPCLKTTTLPNLIDSKGRVVRTPGGTLAAGSLKMEAGLIAASRVARAGAHLVIFPEQDKAHPTGIGGDIAFERGHVQFRLVESVRFETVSDEDEVSASSLPVVASDINWKTSITKGARFELKRSQWKYVQLEIICAEIVAAVTLGLSRAADEVLLAALIATGPTAYSIGKAATQGLHFDELRALVGTGGVGATVGTDGVLRAAGISAELTGDMAGTLVGAWDRAAIAVHEKIDLHFERTNKNGDLVVTSWANFVPLVPDSAKFWTVEVA